MVTIDISIKFKYLLHIQYLRLNLYSQNLSKILKIVKFVFNLSMLLNVSALVNSNFIISYNNLNCKF